MVDPLSILGAVGVVVALSVSIIKIVKAAKNAGKEREEWVKTLVMVKRYLTKLNSRLEQARKQAEIDRSESWYRELSEAMSGEKDSPRSLLESKLRDIEVKFAPRDGLRHHERVRRGFHLAIKGEVIEMFSRVNELLSDLQDAFEIDQLDRLIDRTTTMHALQVEAKQRDLSRQIRDGLERLSNLDFAKTQNQIYGACYKGRQNSPGQWFINSQEFNAWRTGLVQTLYCVGESVSKPHHLFSSTLCQLSKTRLHSFESLDDLDTFKSDLPFLAVEKLTLCSL